uniref:Amino acid transporter n=1 Tax=Ornithorhynchus anatinus TaxID=9258 RepID=A0A6I8PE81_ORNAN
MDSLGIILPEPAAGGLGEGGGQAWELVPGAAAGRTCCCCHCSCCCRLGPDSAPPPPHYRPGPQECRRVIGCQGWGLTMGRGVPNWPTGRWGSIRVGVAAFWGQHGLLTLSLLSVIVGCLLGGLLRTLQLSDLVRQYFSFPGELLMRMLKMLILPLITSSLMSGLATMDPQVCGRMGLLTITYYLWTTFMAVTVGIVLVLSIHPGAAAQKELTPSPEMSYCTRPGTNSEMNVLGIVIFSATLGTVPAPIPHPSRVTCRCDSPFSSPTPGWMEGERRGGFVSGILGLLLGRMGERGAPLVNVCQSLNEAVMRIVSVAVWYFPFGIVFLIAGKILEMEDPSTVGRKLGLYMITVVTGLSIHGLLLLPSLFLLITRHNPFPFIRGILQALLIALATSSSSATLPITLKCLLENNGIDRRVARFVLPVGATINMDGTALYEAVAAIFIAQVNELDLDLGQVITVSITATAASIGAAGIPQSGLVTMVIVLTSVGLPTEDITLIVAVDWALDRFRTMTNVLGDALAAGIIAHVCHEDFVPKPEEVCPLGACIPSATQGGSSPGQPLTPQPLLPS